MSRRLFCLSLGLTLFLVSVTYAQRSASLQVVDPFDGQIVLTPGFSFANISPTVSGNVLNVTSLNLTVPGTNTLAVNNFQFFDTSGIFSPFLTRNNGLSAGSDLVLGSDVAIGNVAWPQVSPAAPPNIIPGSLSGLGVAGTQYQLQTSQQSGPGLAAARPDFNYVSQKLEFEKLTDSRTGQKDLDLAPSGTRRFIPVGEF